MTHCDGYSELSEIVNIHGCQTYVKSFEMFQLTCQIWLCTLGIIVMSQILTLWRRNFTF